MTSKLKSMALAVDVNGKRAISRWKWLPAVLLLPSLSGCFATSTMVGVREPDLTKVQRDAQRPQVEKVLGKRLWCAGSTNGLTYDIYQYAAKRKPRPMAGTFVLGFDYFSLGILELDALDIRKFAPMKQLVVTYDAQDQVRFVSEPWSVKAMAEPSRRMRCLLPENSGVPVAARPLPMTNQCVFAKRVATLKWDSRLHVAIDGRKLDGRVAELPPGLHTISYSTELGGSVLYGAMILPYNKVFANVELLPGRLYCLKLKRYYPGVDSRVDIFWIEDVNSDETLKCSWPSDREPVAGTAVQTASP